jgi:putative transposase
VAELITKTLPRQPKATTHWNVRAIGDETATAKSTVHRLFQLFGLQPRRTRSFKLSTDPFFIERLLDVVRLYLNPRCLASMRRPDPGARTHQAYAPHGVRLYQGIPHDYQRHGTTTLFAALNVLEQDDPCLSTK